MMTKLHFNYKDVFRALRLGFSAKKIWMTSLGLLFGLAGYSAITYLAHYIAGNNLFYVWVNYRLLPFPDPLVYPFPWYSWLIYGVGVAWLLVSMLVTGTAVTKVAFEQVRGDEFYEAREAFRFAFRSAASVLVSPLLIVCFVVLLAVGGIILGLIGRIPEFGPAFVGLMAFPAFIASLFIVYLLIVLLGTLLLGPAVVGTTRSDTFDTLFEVFSCVNEQPWRFALYTSVVAFLAKFGSFLLGLALFWGGQLGYCIVRLTMGESAAAVIDKGLFNFYVGLPGWWPEPMRLLFVRETQLYGLPQIHRAGEYTSRYFLSMPDVAAGLNTSLSAGGEIGASLLGVCLYLIGLMVIAYGLSVWFTGNALSFAVMVHKKDEKNLFDIPVDEEELIEPVVKPEDVAPGPADGKRA